MAPDRAAHGSTQRAGRGRPRRARAGGAPRGVRDAARLARRCGGSRSRSGRPGDRVRRNDPARPCPPIRPGDLARADSHESRVLDLLPRRFRAAAGRAAGRVVGDARPLRRRPLRPAGAAALRPPPRRDGLHLVLQPRRWDERLPLRQTDLRDRRVPALPRRTERFGSPTRGTAGRAGRTGRAGRARADHAPDDRARGRGAGRNSGSRRNAARAVARAGAVAPRRDHQRGHRARGSTRSSCCSTASSCSAPGCWPARWRS